VETREDLEDLKAVKHLLWKKYNTKRWKLFIAGEGSILSSGKVVF